MIKNPHFLGIHFYEYLKKKFHTFRDLYLTETDLKKPGIF